LTQRGHLQQQLHRSIDHAGPPSRSQRERTTALTNIPEFVGIAKPPQPMPACRKGAG
jgi:hypothetical protein